MSEVIVHNVFSSRRWPLLVSAAALRRSTLLSGTATPRSWRQPDSHTTRGDAQGAARRIVASLSAEREFNFATAINCDRSRRSSSFGRWLSVTGGHTSKSPLNLSLLEDLGILLDSVEYTVTVGNRKAQVRARSAACAYIARINAMGNDHERKPLDAYIRTTLARSRSYSGTSRFVSVSFR